MDYTVHGILQARILEKVAFPFSRESSQLRDRIQVSRIAGRFFTSWATREAQNLSVQFSHSVMSNSLWPRGVYSPWNSPGQNTGVGSLSFLQVIFPTRDQIQVSHIAARFFTSWATGENVPTKIKQVINEQNSSGEHRKNKSILKGRYDYYTNFTEEETKAETEVTQLRWHLSGAEPGFSKLQSTRS